MLLYGASGHCKVIIDCLQSSALAVDGIFDDNPNITPLWNYKNLGTYNPKIFENEKLIISIGDNKTRKKLSTKIKHKFGSILHYSALVSKTAKWGCGSVAFHGAIIQADSIVGNHVIVNTAASVDHECILADYVHISPKAALSGNVSVGEGTHVGTGASIIQGVKIGKWCIIGAGTVIIEDVPDYAVVVGNPGRVIKYRSLDEG